jgi:hypothetical protein
VILAYVGQQLHLRENYFVLPLFDTVKQLSVILLLLACVYLVCVALGTGHRVIFSGVHECSTLSRIHLFFCCAYSPISQRMSDFFLVALSTFGHHIVDRSL